MKRGRSGSSRVVLDPTCFVAFGAVVVGDVTLGARSSVWFHSVLRGDSAPISVAAESNIQDGTVIHVDEGQPARVGARVTVGHRAVIHGCVIEDECLIGMGSIVLSGASIGGGSLIAAGSVVREGQRIPAGSLVVGAPARVVSAVTDQHRQLIQRGASHYVELARTYLARGSGAPRHAHGTPAPRPLGCAVITVSDTRDQASDPSGDRLADLLAGSGHVIVARSWVRDEPAAIRRAAVRALSRRGVDLVAVTGGTGIAKRDRTPEALAPLITRELPGFGELFRTLSHRQVGSAAWLSRAFAGVAKGRLMVVLPGSTAAVELAVRELLIPELGHAARLLGRLKPGA